MIRIPLFALLASAALGCGGSDATPKPLDMGGEDGTKVATLIEDVNEAKGTGKKFANLFAKGATPPAADVKKFSALSFTIVGKPTVTGTEATAKVSVQSDREGKELAQKDWAFVKEGDAWKVKSAPLP